ncbi:polysaccharide deacetylase family protein [Paenibacillus eucommiae]|uniref:Glycoside hydrolase/deacetylase ChbG (UPF0249 family) n=1 Tax=Paenibacillus eucommiae TaxID=1355755 RepID=A0ABS4J6H1_9BACL|nr:polysaccharide deacetylase family protein [Paenibacillus eucommiae]MBP1995383.1 putative glycoside hydrolase/deacetylase ChbG (UPF0249 family) [Paenibacillus eucommiae]
MLANNQSVHGRFLIITADDFGMSSSMNKAIINLFQASAINSAMIMMPCPWAKHAANYAKLHPEANVGIHLTLTSGSPSHRWGPVTKNPSIKSLTTTDGYLLESASDVEEQATEEAVKTEIRNQIEMAIQLEINPTHLDSHDGSLLGLARGRDFLEVAFDLCEEFQLPFKLPKNIVNQPFIHSDMKKLFQNRIESAHKRGISLIDDLICLPYQMENGENYRVIQDKMFKAIRSVHEGITEVVIHPSENTPELRAMTPHWEKREIEYQIFRDGEIKKLLNEENIQLISWKDLRDSQRCANGKNTLM